MSARLVATEVGVELVVDRNEKRPPLLGAVVVVFDCALSVVLDTVVVATTVCHEIVGADDWASVAFRKFKVGVVFVELNFIVPKSAAFVASKRLDGELKTDVLLGDVIVSNFGSPEKLSLKSVVGGGIDAVIDGVVAAVVSGFLAVSNGVDAEKPKVIGVVMALIGGGFVACLFVNSDGVVNVELDVVIGMDANLKLLRSVCFAESSSVLVDGVEPF